MNCNNCNGQMDASQRFCRQCGTPNPNYNPGKSKSTGKVLLAICIAVVVIAIAAVGTFAMMDVMKSPKQRYMQAEGKFFTKLVTNAKELDQLAKTEISQSYQQKMELSIQPDADTVKSVLNAENSEEISKAIGDLKLTANMLSDASKNKYLAEIGLQYKNNSLLSGSAAYDKNRAAIKFPELYEKSLLIDTEKLDELYETLGLDREELPDRVLQPEDILGSIKIDRKELEQDLRKYAGIYFHAIPEEGVTSEKDKIVIRDKEIGCRRLVVDFKDDSFLEMLKELVSEMKKDDTLKHITFSNLKNITDLLVDAGYIDTDEIDEDLFDDSNYEEVFESILDAIEEFKVDYRLSDGLKMTLWVDGKGDVIRRKLETVLKSDNYSSEIQLTGDSYVSKTMKSVNCLLEVNEKFEGGDGGKTTIEIGTSSSGNSNQSDGSREEFVFSFKSSNSGDSNDSFKVTVNTDTKTGDGGVKKDTDFRVNAGEVSVSGTIRALETENKKKKQNSGEYEISLRLEDNGQVYKGKILLNLSTQRDVAVNLDNMFKGDPLELDSIDPEDMDAISEEVQSKLAEVYQQNRELFELFGNSPAEEFQLPEDWEEDSVSAAVADTESEETAVETTVQDTVSDAVSEEAAAPMEELADPDYILPGSDQRMLTYEDIKDLSPDMLPYARNEIYARHGYIFQLEQYQNYFSSKLWYVENSSFSEEDLSVIEKYNAQFIKQYEN